VRFGGGAGLLGASSSRISLKVTPVIRVRGLPATAPAKNVVRLRGTVEPRKRVLYQVLQVRRGLRFATVGTKAVKPRRGRFASSFRPTRRGLYRVYFIVRADRSTARGSTRRRLLTVR